MSDFIPFGNKTIRRRDVVRWASEGPFIKLWIAGNPDAYTENMLGGWRDEEVPERMAPFIDKCRRLFPDVPCHVCHDGMGCRGADEIAQQFLDIPEPTR